MSDPKAQLSALQNDPDAAIEALNERYALCVLGGKPAVLVEKGNGVTFWSQAAFFAMLADVSRPSCTGFGVNRSVFPAVA